MSWVRFMNDGLPCWGQVEGDCINIHSGSPRQPGHHATGERLDLKTTPLLPPCSPSKIVCVGRNYRDHARELGNAVPSAPLLFLKPPSSVLAPGGTIVLPPESSQVEYEGELAVVMAKRCSKLRAGDDVRPYILGVTILNDVTARDLQRSDPQWTRAKGFDTFCPLGPAIVPLEALDAAAPLDSWPVSSSATAAAGGAQVLLAPAPGQGLTIETRVNGALRQRGNTSDFLFPLDVILRSITAVMTLEAEDVIATGTPAGVGPLQPGDRVTVSISGLGTLENVVRQSPA